MNIIAINNELNLLKQEYCDSVTIDAPWGINYAMAIGVGIEHARQIFINHLQKDQEIEQEELLVCADDDLEIEYFDHDEFI